MTDQFRQGMAKAAGLTRAGNLAQATALIQQTLRGGAATAPQDMDQAGIRADGPETRGDVIEGTCTPVEPGDGAASSAREAGDARHAGEPRANTGTDTQTGMGATGPLAGLGLKGVRTGLGETVRRIMAGGMPAAPAPVARGGTGLDDRQFARLSHSGPEGRRDYRLYRPANATGAMPLVLMLHGCTQSPEDFAIGTGMNALAEKHGVIIAYPAQPSGANANKCWNWFRPEDQGRSGEPAILAAIVRAVTQTEAVDPDRIYVAGLSAGGAAAVILGQAYPEVFAAVGVHSGLPAGAARDVPSAFMAMRSGAAGVGTGTARPTIVFHGGADQTVHPANGQAVVAQALAGLPATEAREDRGGTGARPWQRVRHSDARGQVLCEHWTVAGSGHAWSGGDAAGSYTDPAGPDASAEMLRFFLAHRQG